MTRFYNGILAILLILLVILLSFRQPDRPVEECVSFRQTVTGDGPFHFSQRIRNSLYDMEIECKGELILSGATETFDCELQCSIRSRQDDSYLKAEFKDDAEVWVSAMQERNWVSEKQNFQAAQGGIAESVTSELLKFDSRYYIFLTFLATKKQKSELYRFELLIPTNLTGEILRTRTITREEFDRINGTAPSTQPAEGKIFPQKL